MRSKKALKNIITSIVYQMISIICGLIVPRFILSYFGSGYNGLLSSISQFLSCASLLVAGVGGVTRASLYKPLAENKLDSISAIINATQSFMRKIAVIMVGGIVAFACIYPLLVHYEFEWFFSFSLVLILGISTFLQYYFGVTYQILLQADQRQYVISVAQIVSTVINTFFAVILLKLGFGIHVVKLGSAIAFSLNPLIINLYVARTYKLDKRVQPNASALKQRWDAFTQAIAYFVHNNTDVIVLTVFADIKEVSVYTVYNYIITNIRAFIVNFITGFGAAFGNMLAKGEMELAKKNLKAYELIIFSLTSIVYTTAGIMIVPFALLYTKGVNDVSYYRPLFALIATVAGAFSCFRIPYQTIVEAAGHYKQTRNGAVFEAVINILISLIAVSRFGIVGVAMGTLVATIFRSVQYALYLSRHLIPRSIGVFIGHVFLTAATAGLTLLVSDRFIDWEVLNFLQWIGKSCCVAGISMVFTLIFDMVFYRKDVIYLIIKIRKLGNRKSNC